MSERGKWLLFVVSLLALAGGAALLLGVSTAPNEGESLGANGKPVAATSVDERRSETDQVLAAIRKHIDEHEEARKARRTRKIVGDPRDERDVGGQQVRTFAVERAAAEAVARDFFTAFSRYEVGRISAPVERKLRASATTSFARELLSAPPRLAPGAAAPTRARLARLDFVPGESRGGRLVALEFVGLAARDRERTPLALALRRTGGGWHVDALGR